MPLRPGGISCASCVSTIEQALLALPGVDRAAVNMGTERVTIDYDPARWRTGQLRRAITDSGYELLGGKARRVRRTGTPRLPPAAPRSPTSPAGCVVGAVLTAAGARSR